jgi:hypothetical protein
MDELEDSPEPEQNGAGPSTTGSPASKAKSSAAAAKAGTTSAGSSVGGTSRSSRPPGQARPVDQLTIEEIEALPAAKRRKSLKARGAAGPGRGWRKGLKMDQKPVYVAPGDSPPTKVASGTPGSFASRPRSSLARDAMSKTGTPFRSESPYSRSSPNGIDDMLLEGEPRIRKEEEKKTAAPSGPTRIYHRSVQPVLPLAKIPIGFLNVTPLDKSGAKKPVRPWKRQHREVVNLLGKSWMATSWVTQQQNMARIGIKQVSNIAEGGSAPSTPGEVYRPLARQPEIRPSPLSAQVESTSLDWRGNSAAFNAAVKQKKVL